MRTPSVVRFCPLRTPSAVRFCPPRVYILFPSFLRWCLIPSCPPRIRTSSDGRGGIPPPTLSNCDPNSVQTVGYFGNEGYFLDLAFSRRQHQRMALTQGAVRAHCRRYPLLRFVRCTGSHRGAPWTDRLEWTPSTSSLSHVAEAIPSPILHSPPAWHMDLTIWRRVKMNAMGVLLMGLGFKLFHSTPTDTYGHIRDTRSGTHSEFRT